MVTDNLHYVLRNLELAMERYNTIFESIDQLVNSYRLANRVLQVYYRVEGDKGTYVYDV